MRRRLLNLLTALSLMLCAAACALWVRSYWAAEVLEYHDVWEGTKYSGDTLESRTENVLSIRFSRGELTVVRSHAEDPNGHWAYVPYPAGSGWIRKTGQAISYLALYEWDWTLAGFALTRHDSLTRPDPAPFTGKYVVVVLPMSFPVAFASVLPATWLLRRMNRRRIRRRVDNGLCPRCAFDLTGNVSGVCPECGTPKG